MSDQVTLVVGADGRFDLHIGGDRALTAIAEVLSIAWPRHIEGLPGPEAVILRTGPNVLVVPNIPGWLAPSMLAAAAAAIAPPEASPYQQMQRDRGVKDAYHNARAVLPFGIAQVSARRYCAIGQSRSFHMLGGAIPVGTDVPMGSPKPWQDAWPEMRNKAHAWLRDELLPMCGNVEIEIEVG